MAGASPGHDAVKSQALVAPVPTFLNGIDLALLDKTEKSYLIDT